MDPTIAVVCAAHTRLGKLVLRNLLCSPSIHCVHALAEEDPRDELDLSRQQEARLRLHIYPLNQIERTLTDHVPEAHISFCPVAVDNYQFSNLNSYQLHKINFDVPRRFIHQMFRLGVHNISILLHGQFGIDLQRIVERLHLEAPHQAPLVSFFKVPNLITTRKAPRISSRSRPIHVRQLAKAMVFHAVKTKQIQPSQTPFDPSGRLPKPAISQINPDKIMELAKQAHFVRPQNEPSLNDDNAILQNKVSEYALEEGAFRLPQSSSSSAYSYASEQHFQSLESPSHQLYPDKHHELLEDSDDKLLGEDRYQSLPRTQSPIPSSEPRRFEEHFDQEDNIEDCDPYQYTQPLQPPITSVESLGNQRGRRLTDVRDNHVMPDAMPILRHQLTRSPSQPTSSHRKASYNDEPFLNDLSEHPLSHVSSLHRPRSSYQFSEPHTLDQSPIASPLSSPRTSQDLNASRRILQSRSQRTKSQPRTARPSSLTAQITAFASKLIAATDRPPQIRRHRRRRRSYPKDPQPLQFDYEDEEVHALEPENTAEIRGRDVDQVQQQKVKLRKKEDRDVREYAPMRTAGQDDDQGRKQKSRTRTKEDGNGDESAMRTAGQDDDQGRKQKSRTRTKEDGNGDENAMRTAGQDDDQGRKQKSRTRTKEDGNGDENAPLPALGQNEEHQGRRTEAKIPKAKTITKEDVLVRPAFEQVRFPT